MITGRRYLTGSMRLITGRRALSTLQNHLEDLEIRNPEWIVCSSLNPYTRTRVQPIQHNSEEPVDAMIVLGGTGELLPRARHPEQSAAGDTSDSDPFGTDLPLAAYRRSAGCLPDGD